jgi:nucleotide-binding universal stress UspA family protein
MFQRILVPVDGSPTSNRGLKTAIELALDQGARLDILHVIDQMAVTPALTDGYAAADYVATIVESLRESGHRVLAKAKSAADARAVDAQPILVESRGETVAHEILKQARKQKADVIVLGTHGRRGLRRMLLGSDAETVVRESPVPVLLVRGTARGAGGKSSTKAAPR